jgi:hypothetical protein
VKIEDPDEPFLKQADEIAFEFINFRSSSTATSALAPVMVPVYPKKAAGDHEPDLLGAEEGEIPQAEPELLLPAHMYLPQFEAAESQQQQQATPQARAIRYQRQQATGGQPPTVAEGQQLSLSRTVSGNNN